MMVRKGRTDSPVDRTDHRESIVMAETVTSNEDILRMHLNMQQILSCDSGTPAPAID